MTVAWARALGIMRPFGTVARRLHRVKIRLSIALAEAAALREPATLTTRRPRTTPQPLTSTNNGVPTPTTEKGADKNRAPNRSGSRVEARGRARLLVDPDFRRRGVARALMQTARSAAVADQRVPVLEVVDSPPAAIAVYRDSG